MQSQVAEHLTMTQDEQTHPRSSFDILAGMEDAGIPRIFRRMDWKFPKEFLKYIPPLRSAERYQFRGLFLTGPTGTKKTASLCLLVREWLIQLSQVRAHNPRHWFFISFPTLKNMLQESWMKGAENKPSEIIDKLANVPLLIVDEWGMGKCSDFVLDSTYDIINRREWEGLPTYGTGNLTMSETSDVMDSRIVSRIKGMCDVISVGGADQRAVRG